MAVDLDGDTSTEYVDYSFAPVTAAPITMAAWIYHNSPTDGGDCIMQLDLAASGSYIRIGLGDGGSNNPRIRYSSGDEAFGPASGLTANTWHSFVGTASSTSMKGYTDGVQGTENTGTFSFPITPDSFCVGYENDSSPGDPWLGRIMWPCMWNTVLTQEEVDMFAAGAPPWMIRPESLQYFAGFTQSGDYTCWITGNTGSANGTPATAEGPHIMSLGGIMVPSLLAAGINIIVPTGPLR